MKTQQLVMSDTARMYVYFAYGLVGLVLGSIQVAYATIGSGIPTWGAVAIAVYAYLGSAFGYTAGTHTTTLKEGTVYIRRHFDHDGDGIADFPQE